MDQAGVAHSYHVRSRRARMAGPSAQEGEGEGEGKTTAASAVGRGTW